MSNIAIISSREVFKHPIHCLSARYWVNVKAGKTPYHKNKKGYYVPSHTKMLNDSIYMILDEARELNTAIYGLRKAQARVEELSKDK